MANFAKLHPDNLIAKAKKLSPKQAIGYLFLTIAGLFVIGSLLLVTLVAIFARDLPDPNNLTIRAVPQTTILTDRTGKTVLYQLYGNQKRTIIEINQISPYIIKATLSAEDKDFFNHKGFDPKGILRSIWVDVSTGQKAQGGSTITQQLVKNSILTNEKTLARKIKEIILSIEVERRFSKEQILKLYFNEIPYGGATYGVEAASQGYFGKSAKDLNLKESVLLAAVVKAPTYYSPYGQRQSELKARMTAILASMFKDNLITQKEFDAAKKDDVLARVQPKRESIIAPHFVFYVRDQLATMFGEDNVLRSGLKVTTTLDTDKQTMAEDALKENTALLAKWKASTAAMTAIDPKTGDILAMLGSANYFDDKINGKFNSLLGLRQPGSSIKPFVYAAAFEKGYTPSTVVLDAATTFPNYPTPYTPVDYDGKERGPVTFKEALAGSLNIPAVQVLYLVGFDKFKDITSRLGYSTFADQSKYSLSVVLGGGEVRPLEHIAAFSALAGVGSMPKTRVILKVEDSKGNVLFDATTAPPTLKQVFEPEIARQVTDILSDNSARAYIFGLQNYLTLPDRPVATKSGTTNQNRDAWTIGYTPSLVAGVWAGNADNTVMKPGADGSKVAAPIWNAFMKKALVLSAPENFTPAQPVVTGKPILDGDKSMKVPVKLDRSTGRLATSLTPPEYVVQRGYGQMHSILFYVDKDNPRGDYPTNPAADSQFSAWEEAISTWATKQGVPSNDTPPVLNDDVHIPENIPAISFVAPIDNQTISTRTLQISVSTSAKRGVSQVTFAIDGEALQSSTVTPFTGSISIPNRFEVGFHTLTAEASDDVGNTASAAIKFNLTAELLPSNLQITARLPKASFAQIDFPVAIQIVASDPKEINSINVTAVNNNNQLLINVGSFTKPTNPTTVINWSSYPGPGSYTLTIATTEKSNATQSQQLTITVK